MLALQVHRDSGNMGSQQWQLGPEDGLRALILQFEPDDCPRHLGQRFTALGVGWDVVHMYGPHDTVSIDGYDMLVALGGAMSANDVDRYPFLDEAMDLIRVAVGRDIPYLGICLGGQLVAKALGAPVTRNPVKEVGRVAVTLSHDARRDPLLAGVGPVLQTVQFHEDTFALPDGAVLLGSSSGCINQIARCAPSAYALQFHPEASWQDFSLWIEHGYVEFAGPENAERGAQLAEDVRRNDVTIRRHADILFDNFVRLAVASPAIVR